MNKKTIKENYETACNEYLRLFCEKHEFEFEPDSWISGDIGGIACVADYYVDMHTIRTDIDTDAPEKEFIEWHDYCVRAGLFNIITPNFRSWIKGCPRKTESELLHLEALRNEILELSK
jgi:hypothetical protein